MIIQMVSFETELTQEEVLAVAAERIDQFRALPGLVQKYYVKLQQPERYGGVYLWDSMESLSAYRQSALAASIARAYRVRGRPSIETMEVLFPLREAQ